MMQQENSSAIVYNIEDEEGTHWLMSSISIFCIFVKAYRYIYLREIMMLENTKYKFYHSQNMFSSSQLHPPTNFQQNEQKKIEHTFMIKKGQFEWWQGGEFTSALRAGWWWIGFVSRSAFAVELLIFWRIFLLVYFLWIISRNCWGDDGKFIDN